MCLTLEDVIRKSQPLWLYCSDCGHERDIDPKTMTLPSYELVQDVASHMMCSSCGSRALYSAPEFYPGGVKAMRKSHRRS